MGCWPLATALSVVIGGKPRPVPALGRRPAAGIPLRGRPCRDATPERGARLASGRRPTGPSRGILKASEAVPAVFRRRVTRPKPGGALLEALPTTEADLPLSRGRKVATWLILPVVICLSQRLSHACLSISKFILRNCEWLIISVIEYSKIPYYLDNRGNSRANTCENARLRKGRFY